VTHTTDIYDPELLADRDSSLLANLNLLGDGSPPGGDASDYVRRHAFEQMMARRKEIEINADPATVKGWTR
jgi:hypothetical protein